MKKLAWWLWNSNLPLGRLAPYVLGVALGNVPHKVKKSKPYKRRVANDKRRDGKPCTR